MKKRRKKSVMHALMQTKTVPGTDSLPEEMLLASLRRRGFAPDASDRILQHMKKLGVLLKFIDRIVFLRPDPTWRNHELGIGVRPPEEMEEMAAQGRIREDVGLAEQDKTGAIALLSSLIWTARTVHFPSDERVALTMRYGRTSPKWLARHVRIGAEVTDAHLQAAKSLLERDERARSAAWGLFN